MCAFSLVKRWLFQYTGYTCKLLFSSPCIRIFNVTDFLVLTTRWLLMTKTYTRSYYCDQYNHCQVSYLLWIMIWACRCEAVMLIILKYVHPDGGNVEATFCLSTIAVVLQCMIVPCRYVIWQVKITRMTLQ